MKILLKTWIILMNSVEAMVMKKAIRGDGDEEGNSAEKVKLK